MFCNHVLAAYLASLVKGEGIIFQSKEENPSVVLSSVSPPSGAWPGSMAVLAAAERKGF